MNYSNIKSQLPDFNLLNKRVFLRADLNVPLHRGQITNDFRLKAIQPTLDFIIKKKCALVLATHLGRPKGWDKDLSTELLIPWFKQHGYPVTFASTPAKAQELLHQGMSLVLLENLRFFPGEKNEDVAFAQELATLADYYVNDAFATVHRHDSSIVLLPALFDINHRTIGFLIEREIAMLSKLITSPKKPFIFIIGGGKIETKLPVIEQLLTVVNTILLAPAIAFTFLKAENKEVGNSLIDLDAVDTAQHILHCAAKQNIKILFPSDYQIAQDTIGGKLSIVSADEFPKNGIGISIGPQTINQYIDEIKKANTIFYNCAMGFFNRPETLIGSEQLLQEIAHSKAFSVIGGGDSVSLAQRTGFSDKFSFLSTGGGATLYFLAGRKLPGLDAII